MKVEFILNGKPAQVETAASRSLLQLVREDLGLTGTKCGCDTGDCGVCTVLVDGSLTKSCLVAAAQLSGRSVTTIEGIRSESGGPNDLQQAFLRHGAIQCGYCIPAMVLAGEALLRRNPAPTRAEIRTGINSVLCRCIGYQQIVDAIEETAKQRQGLLKAHGLYTPESAR
jgi:carbon-monoxide dehydrogenase small subunit